MRTALLLRTCLLAALSAYLLDISPYFFWFLFWKVASIKIYRLFLVIPKEFKNISLSNNKSNRRRNSIHFDLSYVERFVWRVASKSSCIGHYKFLTDWVEYIPTFNVLIQADNITMKPKNVQNMRICCWFQKRIHCLRSTLLASACIRITRKIEMISCSHILKCILT